MKRLKKLLMVCIFAAVAIFALLEGAVIHYRHTDTAVASDAAIVLGHSISDDNYPEPYSISRLDTAYDLYQADLCDYIILSGGQGPQDNIPVAEAMKDYLIEKGVPENRLITEEESSSTKENMAFSRQIAETYGFDSLIVVSNDFHMYRAMLIAKDYFHQITGAYAPSPKGLHTLLLYIREPFALLKYFLLP